MAGVPKLLVAAGIGIGAFPATLPSPPAAVAAPATKTESFDVDPGWDRANNRPADRGDRPVEIRQGFGFSNTSHAAASRENLGLRLRGGGAGVVRQGDRRDVARPADRCLRDAGRCRRGDESAAQNLQCRHSQRVANGQLACAADQWPRRPFLRLPRILHVQVAGRRRRSTGGPFASDWPNPTRRAARGLTVSGLVTPWIDGNAQVVYFDDITYSVGQ